VRAWRSACKWVLVLSLTPAVAGAADEKEKTEHAAIQAVQMQLRHRVPAERVAALVQLRKLPSRDAARVIVPNVLLDPAEEVRRAARQTLLAWRDRAEVGEFLLVSLEREKRSAGARVEVLAPLMGVLLAWNQPDCRSGAEKLIEASLANSKPCLLAVIAVADELALPSGTERGALEALGVLKRLARLPPVWATFAARRAVVQAMIRIRRPQALETLIELLPNADGEVGADIVRHLAAVTEQPHGTDAAAWLAWWKANKDGFVYPAQPGNAARPEIVQPAAGVSYYGLAIHARRIVFVIDASASMSGPRIEAAKRELIQAIEALPAGVSFSVIGYAKRPTVWQPVLVPANALSKQRAARFVYNLVPGDFTASFDALEAAFLFDAEAIYFLSDGAPTAGKVVRPAEIVRIITQVNRTRRISVYTIGIAPGLPGNPLDEFLKTLAAQNFGLYRRVDQ